MDIRPSEEQQLLRDMVQRFLADSTPAAEAAQAPMSRDHWRAMADLGLLGIALPEAAGGMGGAPQDAAIIAEELGRAFAISPFAETVLGAVDLVARRGSPAQIARWVQPAVAGRVLLALAIGDVAERDEKLAGRCDFVRWGAEADALVVVSGSTAYLVEADAADLDRYRSRLADGSVAASFVLKQCAAEPLSNGDEPVERSLAMAQLGYVAEMVGIMSTLLDQTLDYARQRQQFGVAIATFQVVQHKLARMFVRLEQSRSLLLKASLTARNAPDFARNVLAAKAYVAEAAQSLAEDAVHLHGGMGVTDELPAGRALRRVVVLARLFGPAEDARRALAA